MASLGQELKRERELRSISLQDIATQTKIGVNQLKALEDDRLDFLPGKFLTKAILRAYAKALGLDEEWVMNKYHEQLQVQEQTARSGEWTRALLSREPRPGKKRPLLAPILLVAAALVAALACLYIFVIAPLSGSKPPAAVETAKTPPAAEKPAPEFPALPPVVGAGRDPSAQTLRLEFEFIAPTWMHVAADGALVFEGLRNPGSRETLEARTEVVLHTGNAGGFRLRINGRPVRPLGGSGAVLTDVRIRRDNLEQFLEGGK